MPTERAEGSIDREPVIDPEFVPRHRAPKGFALQVDVPQADMAEQWGYSADTPPAQRRVGGVAEIRVLLPTGEVLEASGRASFAIDPAGNLCDVYVHIPHPQPPGSGRASRSTS